jgi:hypothetical protein
MKDGGVSLSDFVALRYKKLATPPIDRRTVGATARFP